METSKRSVKIPLFNASYGKCPRDLMRFLPPLNPITSSPPSFFCIAGSLCDFPFPVVSHLVPLVSPTATLDTAYSIELHCNRLHFQWVLIHLSQSLVLSHTFPLLQLSFE
ncbi:hypothetical protein CDAR_440641 [Caerostris darwini]|uniref:Uncharacterized protein n=1 Tax=Caerostris darwini TaxID=1538125 RepID=A0AAV4MM64_9ARAC|nr:hypothetical protein CDAR_440641 [Caerostris darwini]